MTHATHFSTGIRRGCKCFVLHVTAALVMTSLPANAAGRTPAEQLAQADQFANQANWYKAAPLYAQAEAAFRARGDERNALYAKFGRLHRNVESGSYRAVRDEVSRDLQRSTVQSDPQLKIRALSLLGNIDLNIDTAAAVEDWKQVLATAKAIPDAKWENRSRGQLGLLAGINGDIASAGMALYQAISKAEELDDIAGQLHFSVWLANGMALNGRADKALGVLDRAEALAEKNWHDVPLDLYIAKIRALTSLPEDQAARGRDQARTVIRTALQKAQESGIVIAEGALLGQAGQFELAARNYPAAEDALTKAAKIAGDANLPREQGEALMYLARVYRNTNRSTAASSAINHAIEALQRVDEAYDLPRYIAERAEVEAARGQFQKADASFGHATSLIEGLLVNAPSSVLKASMIGSLSQIYIGHFRLAWEQLHNAPKAFRILESARGRALADSIKQDGVSSQADGVSKGEAEIVSLQKRLLHGQLNTNQIRRTLADLENAYERMIPADWKTGRAEARLRRAPVTLAALRRQLRPNQAIVEYLLDAKGSYALRVTRSGLTIQRLPPRPEFSRAAREFVKAVQGKQESLAASQALYRLALAPILTPEINSLIVVPDGPLHLVPFAALADDTGAFIGQRLTLSSAPSATVYSTLNTSAQSATAPKTFLGLAFSPADDTATADRTRGVFDLRGTTVKPLRYSREEITVAAENLGGGVTLSGPDASELRLKRESLADYRVLHFAAHGFGNETEPDRAGLLMTAGGASEDGLWQAREIRRTRLRADLVVLSACETGVGRLQGQEGVMNLARTFLASGAHSVVASLWAVDDRSTASLMGFFYKRLADGAEIAEALRQAQADFTKAFGPKAPPYYWAGFEVIGDGTRRISGATGQADRRAAGARIL